MPSIGENGTHIVAKSFCIKWWVGRCKSCHGVNPGLTHGVPQNLILYTRIPTGSRIHCRSRGFGVLSIQGWQ